MESESSIDIRYIITKRTQSFSILNCRPRSDSELAALQINFFEQILFAVLLNPEGKDLVITHPEDMLLIWKDHKKNQSGSNSAQISTTVE